MAKSKHINVHISLSEQEASRLDALVEEHRAKLRQACPGTGDTAANQLGRATMVTQLVRDRLGTSPASFPRKAGFRCGVSRMGDPIGPPERELTHGMAAPELVKE